MLILLDVGIGLEINVLTSKFILLGDQMLDEMGCHPEICFYRLKSSREKKTNTEHCQPEPTFFTLYNHNQKIMLEKDVTQHQN